MSLDRLPKWARAYGYKTPPPRSSRQHVAIFLTRLLDVVAQSFVLNPLAGLVGADGKPTMVLVDEGGGDDGKKKKRGRRRDDDSDSDGEDDSSAQPWWQCW